MTKKITYLVLIALFLASCSSKQKGSEIIRVNDAKSMQLNLSDYVVSLEYVPLETKSECLIDRNPSFYVLDEFIVATTQQQCFLFDRNGKFIREIGRPGRGADEYRFTLGGQTINEKKQTILMLGWNKIIEHSFNGTVTNHFPVLPRTRTETAYASESVLVRGIANYSGDAISKLVFFNQENAVDSIPNYQFFNPLNPSASGGLGGEFYFYRHSDDLYYKHLFNDTIFRIKDRKLHPVWVFDMGNYHLSYSISVQIWSTKW